MSKTYKNDLFKKKNPYESRKIRIYEKIRTSGNTAPVSYVRHSVEYLNSQFLSSSVLQRTETQDDGLSISNSDTLSVICGSVTSYGQKRAVCARFQYDASFCRFLVDFSYQDACNHKNNHSSLIPPLGLQVLTYPRWVIRILFYYPWQWREG